MDVFAVIVGKSPGIMVGAKLRSYGSLNGLIPLFDGRTGINIRERGIL
jgi:hypothetical protein